MPGIDHLVGELNRAGHPLREQVRRARFATDVRMLLAATRRLTEAHHPAGAGRLVAWLTGAKVEVP